MAKQKIEPNIILNVYTHINNKVIFIVTDETNNILYMDNFIYFCKSKSCYSVRKEVVDKCKTLITQFNIDTILIEQTKLFTDGITRFPDPVVFNNVIYSFGIQISIEDHFRDIVKYILVIPRSDWTRTILNIKTKYSIDMYKQHILNNIYIYKNDIEQIRSNNYYQALCFSESIQHESLLDKKYLIE